MILYPIDCLGDDLLSLGWPPVRRGDLHVKEEPVVMLIAHFQHGFPAAQITHIEEIFAGIRWLKEPGFRQLGAEETVSRFRRAGPQFLAIHYQHHRDVCRMIRSGAVNLQVVRLDRELGGGHAPGLRITLVACAECLFLSLARDRVVRAEGIALHPPVRRWRGLHVEIE